MKIRLGDKKLLVVGLIVSTAISVWSIMKQSIRLDEAQSLWMSTKSIPELLNLTARDVHVPLYGILLHFWLKISGNNIVFTRLLSLLLLILSLPGLYKLTKEASSEKTAVVAVILFSLSPFVLWYGGETRMYTLFLLTTINNQIFFLRMLRTRMAEGKMGYLITSVLSWYSHYFYALLAAAQVIYGSRWIWKESEGKKRWENLAQFMALIQAAVVCLIPWMIFMVEEGLAAQTQPLLAKPTSYNLVGVYFNFLLGFQDSNIQAFFVSLWPLLGIILIYIFTKKGIKRPKNLTYFLMATFLPVLMAFGISLYRPVFLARYLILTTPTLFILMAWLLVNQGQKVRKFSLVLLMGIMMGLGYYQAAANNVVVKEDYQQLAEYLSKKTTPSDVVSLSAPFTIYPVEYSYLGRAKLTTIPEWNRYTSNMPDFDEVEMKRQIDGYKESYDRLFLVLSYDQGYEENIRNYMDNNYQLLEDEVFPANIKLRVYQLKYN